MEFDTAENIWRNVEGESLPMPLDRANADAMALVARTGDLWSFNGSVTLDNAGFPHIGVTMGEDIGQRAGGPKAMRHFRWTGDTWVTSSQNPLPVSNGDLLATSSQMVRFLIRWQTQEGDGLVGWWVSDDGGQTFAQSAVLLRRPNANFAISSFIRNAHPDARVIVAEIPPDTTSRRMYLLGDGGPVGRLNEP